MKAFRLIAIMLLGSSMAFAQDKQLVADQNPRYAESRDHYMRVADSLTSNQSTTVQDTYKAYDFYEARMERRQERRAFRRQAILSGAYNGYYNNSWGYYSPYGWGNNINAMWFPSNRLGLGFGRWW